MFSAIDIVYIVTIADNANTSVRLQQSREL